MDVHALAIEWLDRPVKHPENTTREFENFINRIRAATLKEAADRVRAEKVEDTGTEGDTAYNMAIDHAIAAIMEETNEKMGI